MQRALCFGQLAPGHELAAGKGCQAMQRGRRRRTGDRDRPAAAPGLLLGVALRRRCRFRVRRRDGDRDRLGERHCDLVALGGALEPLRAGDAQLDGPLRALELDRLRCRVEVDHVGDDLDLPADSMPASGSFPSASDASRASFRSSWRVRGIVIGIGAWPLTRPYRPCAPVLVGGGTLIGLSLAFMRTASMCRLWPWRAPQAADLGRGMQGRRVG